MMNRPITCAQVREGITGYLEEAPPLEPRPRYSRHFLSCRACTAHLRQIRWTIEQLRALPTEPLPPSLKSTLLHAFHERRSA